MSRKIAVALLLALSALGAQGGAWAGRQAAS